ncbi:DotA/TraY family protein [Dyella ginsengisoli]|uniref:DotA/TraY family protein n=1 Tax=Dyella ginsengisoli TaxID=363848 RepID=UPI00034800F4|nr:DotA/TraY family protein [Dyella ginsengisoli]
MKIWLIRLCSVFLLVSWLAPLPVLAQSATGSSLGEIGAAAKRPDDKSREALVAVFGQVVNDPLSGGGAGGGDTLLAAIFQRTNVALLSIAGVIVGWGVFRRVAATAGSGSVFDAQNSSLWMPLRSVWGLASLIPTANGWSIAQLVMLWAASVMGVGTANLTVDAAAAALQNGTPLVMSPVMPQTTALARGVFEADLCMHGINYGLAQVASSGGLVDDSEYISQVADRPDNNGFVLEDGHGTYSCGGAAVDPSQLEAQPQNTNLFDTSEFTVADVYKAHVNALAAMQQTLNPAAKAYVQAVMEVQSGKSVAVPDPNVAIASAAAAYENTVEAQAAQKLGDMNQLSGQMVQSLSQKGWWMLGSWYQTFAMANTKLSSAVAAMASSSAPSPVGAPGPMQAWQAALSAYHTQLANSTAADTIGTPASGPKAATAAGSATSLIKTIFAAPGQRLVQAMVSSGEDRGQMNPLIRLKNLGDYTLAMAEATITVMVGLEVVNEIKSDKFSVMGLAAAVGNAVTGAGDAYTGVFKALKPYVFMIVLALLLFGGTLSVYLPMVPFIVWFGAAINWLVVVAEGIVAAPLWAIAHLGVDGEGFGQKSMHGYLFLLNMCVRPFLMCIGFFVGGGIMTVGGTFAAEGFTAAVANAQFNSITGLVSILLLFWLFVQICVRLTHDSFNLILVLPDQVINWVGGYASARLGMEADKVSSGFAQGAEKAGSTHERGSDRIRRDSQRLPTDGNGMSD